MGTEIYKGSSDGFRYLLDGYLDYADEVISRRAIPDVRDGLKVVQRRILYSAKINDKKQFQKCATFVADAMKLHPHGDSSVYGAFTLMTDVNGSWNVPVFKGMGNLGKVYSSNPPAAYRYPKAMLHANAEEYFHENEIFHLVQSEEGDGVEPEVLYPSFPTVLVNGTAGIAVSIGTRIPSFNFGDVINLTAKYIREGNLSLENGDIIYPDFPTGGVLVKNDSEVAKVMMTGIGKLKLRAKVEISGNEIVVTEVPYGKTFEGIVKAIDNADIRDIKSAMNLTGNDSNGKVVIVCKSKRAVEPVLLELYRKNILQSTFASNIIVVNKDKPLILGVYGIIEEWVKFRREVIVEKFQNELNKINADMLKYDYFVRLVSNEEWRDEYVSRVTKVSKKAGDEYLHTIFNDIPQDVADWIVGRALSVFNNGGTYRERYMELVNYKAYCEEMKGNPDKYILDELGKLLSSNSSYCERKTFISPTDYRFSKITESEAIIDDSYCIYSILKDGYIIKSRDKTGRDDVMLEFEGCANSDLVGFDNYGRVLRINGSDIDFTMSGDRGEYLPKLFGASDVDDYKVLYMCVCDGSKKMLVYRDGYVGFFDTSEWVGKKIIRVTKSGVPLAVMDKLLEVYEEGSYPQYLLLGDMSGKKLKIALVKVDSIAERSRTSRAKVLSDSSSKLDTRYIMGMSVMQMLTTIKDPERFMGKLGVATDDAVFDDVDINLNEGHYVEYCPDLEQ